MFKVFLELSLQIKSPISVMDHLSLQHMFGLHSMNYAPSQITSLATRLATN